MKEGERRMNKNSELIDIVKVRRTAESNFWEIPHIAEIDSEKTTKQRSY